MAQPMKNNGYHPDLVIMDELAKLGINPLPNPFLDTDFAKTDPEFDPDKWAMFAPIDPKSLFKIEPKYKERINFGWK